MGKKKTTQPGKAATKSAKASSKPKESTKPKKDSKKSKVNDVSKEDEEEYWRMMEEASKRGHKKGASPRKRSQGDEEEDEDEEESSDSDDSDDDELRFDTVEHISEQYTFEFKDMKADFSEGICTLLQYNFLDNPTHAYELATHITAQETVGTVVVCEDGDDVFAFATICPLYKIKSVSIDKFTSSLSSSLGDSENSALMQTYLAGNKKKHCGLLIHRRFANLPLQLVSHLHTNLNDDMSWAASLLDKQDDAGDSTSAQDHVDFKNIDHIILFSACAVLDTTTTSYSTGGKKKKKGEDNGSSSSSSSNGHAIDVTGSSSVILDYFEDDVYFQESLVSFYFKPNGANAPFVASLISVKSLAKVSATIVSLVPTAEP